MKPTFEDCLKTSFLVLIAVKTCSVNLGLQRVNGYLAHNVGPILQHAMTVLMSSYNTVNSVYCVVCRQ